MKLVNADLNISIELKENVVNTLVIENRTLRVVLLEQLLEQCNGGDGTFVLSECDKILKFNKNVDFILNPLVVDCNNKQVLSKLYQTMRDSALELMWERKCELNSNMLSFLDSVSDEIEYSISSEMDFDIVDLCKLYSVKFERTGNSLVERILDYLKVMSSLCGYNIFIFTGLKSYLSVQELHDVIEYSFYNKIHIILLEFYEGIPLVGEKICIIDEDSCIIQYDNNLRHCPKC